MAKGKKSARRPVQAPKADREGRSRGVVIGVLALATLIVVGAIAAFLVSHNSEPEGTAIRAEDVSVADVADEASADIQGLGTVPPLIFRRFDGTVGTFADYEGRPLVVNFFASWCQPCLRELPGFAKLHQSLGGQVAFLGLNLQDDPAAAMAIIEQTGVTYDVASDPNGDLFLAFNGFAMPTTIFVSPDGTILEVYAGELSAGQLEEKIGEYFDA